MTKEELLEPRIITIAEDTSGNLIVGKIFGFDDEAGVYWTGKKAFTPEEIAKFPHLFRLLDWWEYRKPEDMPEYVKQEDGKIFKVEKYVMCENGYIKMIFIDYYDLYCNEDNMCFFEPATEQEYNNFINQKP
jgi:hypothetical protein